MAVGGRWHHIIQISKFGVLSIKGHGSYIHITVNPTHPLPMLYPQYLKSVLTQVNLHRAVGTFWNALMRPLHNCPALGTPTGRLVFKVYHIYWMASHWAKDIFVFLCDYVAGEKTSLRLLGLSWVCSQWGGAPPPTPFWMWPPLCSWQRHELHTADFLDINASRWCPSVII